MIETDLPAAERARRVLSRAREVVRRKGISTARGIEVNAESLIIHLAKCPQQRRIIQKLLAAGRPARLPYRLEIWQYKRLVFSVDYGDLGRIEVTRFQPGAWEGEVVADGRSLAS